MRPIMIVALLSMFCLSGCASMYSQCPPWRPCGPGNSWGGNALVPQGFYGADFRSACAAHDACYGTCADRYDCDQAFLQNMYSACDNSYNPQACYRQAEHYYMMTRMFGGLMR
jgi:hypothetical protein